MNYFSLRLSASCTSGAAMRMHQDTSVAALPEPPILAFSPLAPAYPVELAVFFCFWALAFMCPNVRKGSAPTFDGHTPAVTKEERGRGCVVSHCTPFAGVVLRPIALRPSGQKPPGFLFLFQHDGSALGWDFTKTSR